MSFKRTISTAAASAGILAMSVITLASSAQAYDGRGHGYNPWRGERAYSRHAAPRHYGYRHDNDNRRNRDKAYERGLAIGLGAVIVGGILAAEAHRRNSQYD
jgi:hypothetical protein